MNDEILSWQKNALCIGAPSAIFFEDEPTFARGAYKSFCNRCPVKPACLEYALLYNVKGIWGGTTDKERDRLFSKSYIDMLRGDAIESGTYNFTLKA
jgi:WhiB family redox-sensing transcriptional regulator